MWQKASGKWVLQRWSRPKKIQLVEASNFVYLRTFVNVNIVATKKLGKLLFVNSNIVIKFVKMIANLIEKSVDHSWLGTYKTLIQLH